MCVCSKKCNRTIMYTMLALWMNKQQSACSDKDQLVYLNMIFFLTGEEFKDDDN